MGVTLCNSLELAVDHLNFSLYVGDRQRSNHGDLKAQVTQIFVRGIGMAIRTVILKLVQGPDQPTVATLIQVWAREEGVSGVQWIGYVGQIVE